jgi:hypothetical protein
VSAPTEGLGGAALVGGVLQMVSEPTLTVAHTGQSAGKGGAWRVWISDGTHGMVYGSALDVWSYSYAKREGS